MLSRLALSRLALLPMRSIVVRTTSNVPPGREILNVNEGPERDVKNFPRLKRPLLPGKVRLGFIPEEWFQLFYPKTGVTGPYLFGTGMMTYLYSKEILLMDHEFYVGVTIIAMTVYAVKAFGPGANKYLDDAADAEEAMLDKSRKNELDALQQAIKSEELAQWQADGQVTLFEAKKENVALQLEAEFRRRQVQVYNEVKRRLDYQLEQVNIQRRLQQKHMVNWIVNNVVKSISPQQEKDTLAKCIADLKGLAATNA